MCYPTYQSLAGCAMTKRITSLLRRIVGRIKMYMSAFYLVVGAIMLPISFLVYIETHDKLLFALAFVIGLVALVWGIREISLCRQE